MTAARITGSFPLFGSGRVAALRLALHGMLRKPLTLAVSVVCTASIVAATSLAAGAVWRMWPFERPAWATPSALVFVAGGAKLTDLDPLRGALRQTGTVASVEFIGRDAARAALVARKSLAGSGLNDVQPNPLPNAFIVRFDPAAAPEAIERAVDSLQKRKDVSSVAYEPGAARKLAALTQFAVGAGSVLGVAFAAALVAVFSLIADLWPRVALRVDPDEMRVLQILGAEPAALRRPHLYAGALSMALAGALAAVMVLRVGAWIEPAVAGLAAEYSLRWADAPIPPSIVWLFCPAGGLLGAAIASLSMRAPLRRPGLAEE